MSCPASIVRHSVLLCHGAMKDSAPELEFTGEGYALVPGEAAPRARFRTISPGFFSALGVPLVAGRDFNADDRPDKESVVIISESIARRMFNTRTQSIGILHGQIL